MDRSEQKWESNMGMITRVYDDIVSYARIKAKRRGNQSQTAVAALCSNVKMTNGQNNTCANWPTVVTL